MINRTVGFRARALTSAAVSIAAMCGAAAAYAADNRNGAVQILKGDYAGAERVIVAQEQMFPGDADLLLNLASVYRHTGRNSEARALYRAVLARPDDMMDLADRAAPRTAHAIALAALSGMEGTQLTVR